MKGKRFSNVEIFNPSFHIIVTIVTIAESIRSLRSSKMLPYSRWDYSDRRTHTIAVIITIVTDRCAMVSI